MEKQLRTKLSLVNFFLASLGGLLGSILLSTIISGILFFLFDKYNVSYSELLKQFVKIFIFSSILIGYGFWGLNYYRKYVVWVLKGNQLSRGTPANLTIDLSDIERVSIGLPTSKTHKFLFAGEKFIPNMGRISSKILGTVMIKLDSNRFLPLYLVDLKGGVQLMDGIVNQVADKWVKEYSFSDSERKRLRYSNVNFNRINVIP